MPRLTLETTSGLAMPVSVPSPGVKLPASHRASYLPALDGVRGLAVLMILAFHFWQSLYRFPEASGIQAHLRFLAIGQTGVDLFFVLSGFLITGILLNTKGTPHFLLNFYARRAIRILPLYYLLVLGYLLAGWVHSGFVGSLHQEWWYFLYLQNVGMTFWPQHVGEPGHFWSLGVEEHFYLLWPMLLLINDESRLPWVLGGIVASGVISRLLLIPIVGPDRIFWFSPCRMDALALGALLAVAARRADIANWSFQVCWWTLVSLGPILLLLYPLTSGKAFFAMQAIKYLLVAIAYTALIGSTVGPGRWIFLENFFTIPFLKWCGKYSYAMYVFHPAIYLICTSWLRSNWSLARTAPALYLGCEFIVLLAMVFLVSWTSWHLFEKHFLKMKRFFEYPVKAA